MSRIVLLGTGAALCDPDRENTYLLVEGESTCLLIDCAGSPAQRLARAGVPVERVDALILTHTHPDHIYGLPIFMLDAWLAGRQQPLDIYGLPPTLQAARSVLRIAGNKAWPGFFKIHYHSIDPKLDHGTVEIGEFSISTTVTRHFVPTIAMRITSRATGRSISYTSDSMPFPGLADLARGSRYLFHEATGLDFPESGHSTAVDAGASAEQAGVETLVLIHLPAGVSPLKWRAAARSRFHGHVIVGRDLQSFSF